VLRPALFDSRPRCSYLPDGDLGKRLAVVINNLLSDNLAFGINGANHVSIMFQREVGLVALGVRYAHGERPVGVSYGVNFIPVASVS